MKKHSLIILYNTKQILIILLITVLVGCKPVGPNYEKPEMDIGEQWHTPLRNGLTAEQANPHRLVHWWTNLNDDQLTGLIESTIANNLDIKSALWRVQQSRALRGIEQAGQFPTLHTTGSAKWTRTSKETSSGKTEDIYSSGFDAAWELDIFGGVRRSIEAADADLQSNAENLRDVLVSLVSEVAINYVELRTYQAQIVAVESSIKSQSETYQLTLWHYEAGLEDELATQQARYNLESARAQIPPLHSSLEEAMNRIAVLTGCRPGSIHNELSEAKPIPTLPESVAVGLPADTLRQRPDVRKAENELIAQTARIGVATAELYPKFTLNGSIGIEGLSMNRLASNTTTPANWILSGGPQASWKIFDAGAIRQNIKVQSALQQQALAQYESTILSALEEVENTLTAYANEQTRRVNLYEATHAAEKAALLASQEYEAGLADFSDVLESQRTLLSFRNQLVQSDGIMTSNLIRLYKTLGGGWSYSTTMN